jgi:hypothetical protein
MIQYARSLDTLPRLNQFGTDRCHCRNGAAIAKHRFLSFCQSGIVVRFWLGLISLCHTWCAGTSQRSPLKITLNCSEHRNLFWHTLVTDETFSSVSSSSLKSILRQCHPCSRIHRLWYLFRVVCLLTLEMLGPAEDRVGCETTRLLVP